MKCKHCHSKCIKKGKSTIGKQRFKCKKCNKYQLEKYTYMSYSVNNKEIVTLLKEGCGIRSISRILKISSTTTINRIQQIAKLIKPPFISLGKEYEVDEMCTYIGSKSRKRWIVYAIQRSTNQVACFNIGTRIKKTLQQVTTTVLLSKAKKVYTDKLNIYKSLIPTEIHCTKKYSINHIERMNLTLRTHLKRLNRKTICYSKSLVMLSACLKIYFWGKI